MIDIPARINLTKEKENEIIKLYNDGMSQRKIAEKVGFTRGLVSRVLRENKIKQRNTKETSRRHSHNENFFEVIDTEEKAYWLGFIYADGFIETKRKHSSQKLGIRLGEKDIGHLEKFKKSIEATNPIFTHEAIGGFKEYPNSVSRCSRILITCQKLVDDIKRLGVIENKTHIITFPSKEQIPDELLIHFIRGYFDGDGSIMISKHISEKRRDAFGMNMLGTRNFLEGVVRVLGEKPKIFKAKSHLEYTFCFSIGGNRKTQSILDKLYENATIYLDRKYERYLQLKELNKK